MSADRGLRATGLTIVSAAGVLVRGVDIAVEPGQTTAIVGESGSGKSLTARALVGLVPAGVRVRGSLALDGAAHDLAADGPGTGRHWRRLRGEAISLLLQDPFTSLSPVHTIGRQIHGALSLTRARVSAEDVATRLAEVGLGERVLRQYPHELSGGMRQRVAIVLALASDPAVLVADEPTTALDSITQSEILALIDRLRASRRMGVLLISHDLGVVADHAARVLVMSAGSIVERGAVADVLAHPVHPYTRGLLAAAPHPGSRPYEGPPWLLDPGIVLPAGADFGSYADAETLRSRPAPVLVPVGGRPGHEVGIHGAGAAVVVDAQTGVPTRASHAAPAAPVAGQEGGQALLRVEGLVVHRGGREVLHGVDLDVPRGAIVGLVGQSGSGKTSLARAIVGLEEASAGSITWQATPDGRRGRVQMVFQDPAGTLNPALSIRRTLSEAIRAARGAASVTPEVLLETVGLPAALLSRRPAALSGGQRQRVAIARAIATAPDLLVCDEPVSALDLSVQAQILALLARLRDDAGHTLLFISHDLAVVAQLCDHVVVLNEGVVVESGPTSRVLTEPADPYTRRLLAVSTAI
ncbi:ATP-binding cassette domain-containing protein [Microbacterium ulmi]|uniref:ATP-binding cassette domain-containing protein n=1 Tax=Microbacterium ulmi TaxID=179095 RepID=UPI001ABA4403|nr:peptide/nickel transport system ATP-binding protein [Microbacterium ulmi]